MIDNNKIQEIKRNYPELFNEFPLKFWEFLFSDELSSIISNICVESGIEDENKIEEIAFRITMVLLNRLPKEELRIGLKDGVGLDLNTAETIFLKSDELIFSKLPELQKENKKEKKIASIGEILGLNDFKDKQNENKNFL
ncbi:MAG TPA: hypothetical protein PLE40_01025 [Candidatus Pacearchaeota archaeon]|nr:hypothetical protein [Candidatus Pacearchaeota archaeon]